MPVANGFRHYNLAMPSWVVIWLRAWVSGLGAVLLLALTVSGLQQVLSRLYHEKLITRPIPPENAQSPPPVKN